MWMWVLLTIPSEYKDYKKVSIVIENSVAYYLTIILQLHLEKDDSSVGTAG